MDVVDIDLLELLWVDRPEAYCEVASDVSHRLVGDLDTVLPSIEGGGMRFFAPVARARRGSRKEDVASAANVLWVDTDTPGGLDRIKGLRRYGLKASAIIDTGGRGHHAYFKLQHDLPIGQVEDYNRLLAAAVDGDRGVWNRNRLLRLPGFPHTKTSRPCRVVDLGGDTYAREDLEVLGEPSQATPRYSLSTIKPSPGAAKRAFLPPGLAYYLRGGPVPSQYASRSEAEAAAVVYHLYAGQSDDEIVAQAFEGGWPKTIAEAERTPNKPERWIRRTIAVQRDWLLFEADRKLLTWPEGGEPRRATRLVEAFSWLERLPPRGEPLDDYCEALAAKLPGAKPQRAAERLVKRMVKENLITVQDGLVTTSPVDTNEPQ